MIIVFTGNGKGKTTAAIGQALRALGNGSKVLMVQFIKGPWKSGEDKSVAMLNPDFKIVKMGKGFVHSSNDKVSFEEHVQAGKWAIEYATRECVSGKWNIIILDEIWVAFSLGLISQEDIETFIKSVKGKIDHIIMTGRGCPDYFIHKADLVTEMKEIKHPFASGVSAMKNVEF